jgi:uncharacterized protein (DUF983 family)
MSENRPTTPGPAEPPQATAAWRADRAPRAVAWPVPKLADALLRGLRCRCPACGQGKLFAGFLKVTPACPHCTAPLGTARADDAPPYFTIVIVGHIIVPLLLVVERAASLSLWTMSAIFLPLTLILTLALLRPVKGATLGVMVTFGLLEPHAHG